jgi:hypothetical protein
MKALKTGIEAWKPNNEELESLQPLHDISAWFPKTPSHKLVHIIIFTNILTLNYILVDGGIIDNNSIVISRTETVGALKELINKKQGLTSAPEALRLWIPKDRLSLSLDDFESVQEQAQTWLDNNKPEPLSSVEILENQFPRIPQTPRKNLIHIIVVTSTLTLNYTVLGKNINDASPISISRTETVGALKELISKQEGLTSSPKALQLWMLPKGYISLDDTESALERIQTWLNTDKPEPLRNTQKLDRQFPFFIPETTLHLVVKTPLSCKWAAYCHCYVSLTPLISATTQTTKAKLSQVERAVLSIELASDGWSENSLKKEENKVSQLRFDGNEERIAPHIHSMRKLLVERRKVGLLCSICGQT